MSDAQTPAAVDRLIAKADHLHSPPEVAQSLLNLTRDDNFDVRQIVECIQRDPAMSAKLLQVVNSSRYGLRTSVSNLNQAVALLGQRTVRLIAMTFSIVDTLTVGPAKMLVNEYWRNALTTASAASRIARRGGSLDRNDVYIAGLLADVGSLVMAQCEGESYLELFRLYRGGELAKTERALYGFDHCGVGARLLERWQFPPHLLAAIARHHDSGVEEPLAMTTRAGALVAEVLWEKNPEAVQECRDWLQTHYDVDTDSFTDLAIECREEVLLEMETYGVNAGLIMDCRAILEAARRQYLDSSLTAAMDLDSFEAVMKDS